MWFILRSRALIHCARAQVSMGAAAGAKAARQDMQTEDAPALTELLLHHLRLISRCRTQQSPDTCPPATGQDRGQDRWEELGTRGCGQNEGFSFIWKGGRR